MEVRLIRDHEKEKHEQKPNAPRGGSGAVERVFLRQREERREAAVVCVGEPVDGEEEEERGGDEEELELIEDAVDGGLVVGVPREG